MNRCLYVGTIPCVQSAHGIGEGAKPSSKPYQWEGGSSMTSMHSIRNSLIVHILQGSLPKGLTLVLWETLISNSVHNCNDSTARRPCDESGPTDCSHIKILPSPEFRRNCTIHHKLLYSIFFKYHSASAMPSINRPITLFLGGKNFSVASSESEDITLVLKPITCQLYGLSRGNLCGRCSCCFRCSNWCLRAKCHTSISALSRQFKKWHKV